MGSRANVTFERGGDEIARIYIGRHEVYEEELGPMLLAFLTDVECEAETIGGRPANWEGPEYLAARLVAYLLSPPGTTPRMFGPVWPTPRHQGDVGIVPTGNDDGPPDILYRFVCDTRERPIIQWRRRDDDVVDGWTTIDQDLDADERGAA